MDHIAGHILDKAEKYWPEHADRLIIKGSDLDHITEDPGNTGLSVHLIGFKDGDEPYGDETLVETVDYEEFIDLLSEDEGQGGPGDYEEFIIFTQNNEVGVLVNYNK